jgi:hypothetical protein
MKFAIIAALITALPISAMAQSPDCSEPLTQMDMNDCASRAYVSADALLNQVWKSAIISAKGRDEYLRDGDTPTQLDSFSRSGLPSRKHSGARRIDPTPHTICVLRTPYVEQD